MKRTNALTESIVEQATLAWLEVVGYKILLGSEIAPGETNAERNIYTNVWLLKRLQIALHKLNEHIPAHVRQSVIEEVLRVVGRTISQDLVENNRDFHQRFTEGIDISFQDGSHQRHDKVWLIDFNRPEENEFLAVNQFTVEDVNFRTRSKTHRRPDIVLFVNGLPLVVIELKNAADDTATIRKAYNQLQTYSEDIGSLFRFNALLAISDGVEARLGVLGAGWEFFKPWRSADGETLDPHRTQLETLVRGVFAPARLLDIVRSFIVFEQNEDGSLVKKVAAYHQYHAVNKAVENTLQATHVEGDKKVGVVWHTQGSGKSLSMLFYAGKVIQHPAMRNPTLVILTDRNDLDDQLFGTFAAGQHLLRQSPVRAESRDQLRALLAVESGGVVFTTIQKFAPDEGTTYPLLSTRRNIVFIADEAHRSQYGINAHVSKSGEISYGFAKYVRDSLPNASFIGFTGTPVEQTDINTRQVFGDYIDVYDIQRAVDDGATVPIFYELRSAQLVLREDQRPQIDPGFEEITEGEEQTVKEQLKTKWAQLEAMVGAEARLAQVAQDIVTHFEARQEALEGKGMIVCMSRRIAVELYNELIRLRPDWHRDADAEGFLKVVMTGSAGDPPDYRPHIRSKFQRKALADRFKNANDPFKLVIVRDMWLTGFDAPSLHTMYVDKPMRGHSLMQAIARVNRVFRDKPGGLIVDYLGIAYDLKQAISAYTQNDVKGTPAQYQEDAIRLMKDAHHVALAFFHQFDYARFFSGTAPERLSLIPAAMEHILAQQDGKKRYLDAVTKLSRAYSLSIPHEDAIAIREEVAFFQAVRAAFIKYTPSEGRPQEEIEGAIKQLVSQALTSTGIVNIYDAIGLKTPDISILSDEFLEEMRHKPLPNLVLEMLRRLLDDEIKARGRRNVVQARSFAEMLDRAIKGYQNRAVDAAQVIAELINIAKDVRDSVQRGADLGLSEDEMAFYDALAQNDSAREVMGDKQLAFIALELVKKVRGSVTIDWSVKQSARAKIRVLVKRILREYGYPPDLQEAATDLVLEQAELLAAEWVDLG
jgi:type I restriction enzyme R subunit